MKPTSENIKYMLRESNAIESEYDDDALTNALAAWDYMMLQDSLTPTNIKSAHLILMKSRDLESKYKGEWRDIAVTIGGEVKSQSKILIDSLIRDFCDHVNEVIEKDNKNHDAIHCHLEFENIHPFVDGNGRMGRILLNWQLVKMGMPLLVYTEEDKATYYRIFPTYRSKEFKALMDKMQKDWGFE